MNDDVKALVARLRADAHVPGVAPATALQAADALEAERGHIQSLAKWVGVDESEGSLGIACEVSAALEAAQRPPVAEPDNHHNADVAGHGDYEAGYEEGFHHGRSTPAQRPPATPEVREGMRDALREAHQYDHDFDPEWDYTEDDDRYIDAILARFSFPSQPVYDEEKIARFMADALRDDREGFGSCDFPRDFAAALVAALRGGELTREETP